MQNERKSGPKVGESGRSDITYSGKVGASESELMSDHVCRASRGTPHKARFATNVFAVFDHWAFYFAFASIKRARNSKFDTLRLHSSVEPHLNFIL